MPEFIEPEMIEIPAGSFLYGTTQQEKDSYNLKALQADAVEMTLPAFWIGRYEVGNREYACFIRGGGYRDSTYWSEAGWKYRQELNWTEPYRWRDKDYNDAGKENYPAAAISWYEAEAYCKWLSAKTGRHYRLPTETEWEKAARGTDRRIFPWGNEWNPQSCNWLADSNGDRLPDGDIDGYIRTAPVDEYESAVSPWGCYNMAGNVLEWCVDAWDEREGGVTRYRVFRGGCFLSAEPRLLRCAWRGGNYPQVGHAYWGMIGFRLARDADPTSTLPSGSIEKE